MIDAVILFFIFGLTAGLVRSDLKLPAALYDSLSLVLLLTIGLKGGEGLAKQAIGPLLPQLGGVILLGVAQTFIAFAILRYLGRLGRSDSAATAAHYGSVSVATFAVGSNWLMTRNIAFEPQLTIFLTVMEIPAILVGIVLARGIGRKTEWRTMAHETFLGKGVVLLIGGMAIGWAAGPIGLEPIKGLFYDLFKGALALFLLEMGLIVARQVGELRQRGLFLIAFGLCMPLLSALLGLACGMAMNLSIGGATLLATLAASASYIAVPATMRLAVPEANPALSLAAVLGVTFPFNILVGIPCTIGWPRNLQEYRYDLSHRKRTLITVITEAAIEDALLRDLDKLGARGYTVSDARGRGGRGVRDAAWEEAANIRVEVICARTLAESVLNHIQARYYANYAMVAFLQDVEILRPEKF